MLLLGPPLLEKHVGVKSWWQIFYLNLVSLKSSAWFSQCIWLICRSVGRNHLCACIRAGMHMHCCIHTHTPTFSHFLLHNKPPEKNTGNFVLMVIISLLIIPLVDLLDSDQLNHSSADINCGHSEFHSHLTDPKIIHLYAYHLFWL